MKEKDQTQKIIPRPTDYKYCEKCEMINGQENRECSWCRHRGFRPMDDENFQFLLRDWKNEPEFQMGV